MNIVLCEECFPDAGEHEMKTIRPIAPCVECGRRNENFIGPITGVEVHLFSGDPRTKTQQDTGQ